MKVISHPRTSAAIGVFLADPSWLPALAPGKRRKDGARAIAQGKKPTSGKKAAARFPKRRKSAA
jgi:hypothetical protein